MHTSLLSRFIKAASTCLFFVLTFIVGFAYTSHAYASQTNGTIDATQKYAWGDRIGWINFAPHDGSTYAGLQITDSAVTGYAWSRDYGWINFSPSSSGQGVTNTSNGVLGGSAWVSSLGWISFSGVTINNNGQFVGIAGTPNTDTARVSFDCTGCTVTTDWRPLAVRNGQVTGNTGGGGGGGSGANSGQLIPPTPSATSTTGIPGLTAAPTLRPNNGLLGGGLTAAVGSVGSVLGNVFPGLFGQSTTPANSAQPTNLFDIALSLDQDQVPQGDPISAVVSFTNFGTQTTAAQLTFSVVNQLDQIVATSSATTSVETQSIVRKIFSSTNLIPGRYTLRLHVVYGANVQDDEQTFFTILPPSFSARCGFSGIVSLLVDAIPVFGWFGCIFWWIPLLIIPVLGYLWYRFATRKNRRDRDLKKKL